MTAKDPVYTNEDSQVFTPPTEPMFSEAPAVCFTQLYGQKDGQVVQFNITVRANTGPEVIDELLATIQHAKKYGLSTVRPDLSRPGPAASKPAEPATPATVTPPAAFTPPAPTAPAAPVMPPAPAQPAAASAGKPVRTLHASKLTIAPQADGKVKLEWYEAGHEFPDIYTVRTIEKAAELLAPTGTWTEAYFVKIGTYQVRHNITWQESDKLNSRGNPYRNIISIGLD